MAINVPTHDFVTSSLVDAIDNSQDTMTIGAGLNIPATNGALQIDYDSSIAVGTASGPETVLYATYTTATGAVAGITRGSGGTTAVSHDALASVQCGNSSVYYTALNALYDGWITANETWTRTANTTFTITGDFTGVYAVGDKLKVTDTTTKYFYITACSYSAPDTTVTITGGSDYVLAATPTARYYSKSSSPVGFPQIFNFNGAATGYSVIANAQYEFSYNNGWVELYCWVTGTSNNAALVITAPITACNKGVDYYRFSTGQGEDNGTAFATGYNYIQKNTANITCTKSNGVAFTASGTKTVFLNGKYRVN